MENQLLDSNLTENVHENLQLKPNGQRAKTLITLIWIVLGLEVISLVSSGLQYNLLQTVSYGGEITNEAATANDLREQIVGILYLIAYIASGIAFIMWFRRAYFNLHCRVKGLSFSEGWAAGSWFVPIVNLYRPYQIMKELYVETEKFLLNKNESSTVDLPTNYLGIWWTLWIVSGVLGQIVFRISLHADTIPELMSSTMLYIISGIIGIILAFATIKVIKNYSVQEGLLVTG